MTLGGIHHSHHTDEWTTPPEFYDRLNEEFKFDFDPCPVDPRFNGLEVPWVGNIYVNPPYSSVGAWFEKAHKELELGNARVIVFLVFARTDTRWFHNQVLAKGGEVRFIRGRLTFGKAKKQAPSPSILIIFRQKTEVNP